MLWLLQLLAGALLMSLSANVFLVPLKLAEGGVTGIGIILYHTLGIPLWVTMVALNIPILALGMKVKGWRLLWRSILGVAAYSFFLAVTANIPPITDQVVLAIVYGGLTMGTGLGLVLRSGGTTGGTEVLALVLQQRLGFSVGTMVLAVDAVVLTVAGIVFSPEAAMWAVITLFISSKVVDLVQVGFYSARGVTIITTRPDEIARRIMTEVERGVTIVNGTGAFTGESRTILYTVAQRTELTQIKQIAYAEDPRAFVVVAEVHEVLGEGFREPSKALE